MLLSDRILDANEEVLRQMLDHRFIADIKANRLPRAVFHNYLVHEGAFVNTAISIIAYALARAPDIGMQRWLIGILDALANKQVPFFEDAFVRLGISSPDDTPPDVIAFDRGMLSLARDGSFVDIVTAMFAAEWMYWTWCSDASICKINDVDLKNWVALHAEPAFADQAMSLKAAIDTYGAPEDADRLSAIFRRVMTLEIAFHSAPYDTAATSGSAT